MKIGDLFAGCRVTGICGTGAYGTVYLAEDALQRPVALKVFHAVSEDKKLLEALKRYVSISNEIDILVNITHFGIEDGHLYYIMDAADNAAAKDMPYKPDTLEHRLQNKGRMPLNEALNLYHRLLEGVGKLHDMGLIHRDIKPANLIYVNGKIKLGDPDLLNDYSHTMSTAGGTLGYTPPEFFFQKPTKSPTGDIYAMGKVFYCCVTGEVPEAYPHYPADLDTHTLCRIVLPLSRICSQNPAQRVASCEECRRLIPLKAPDSSSFWQHFLTKMSLSKRLRNCFFAVAALLLIFTACAGYSGAILVKKLEAARHARFVKAEAELQRYKKLVPKLPLQLSADGCAAMEQEIKKAEKAMERGKIKRVMSVLDGLAVRLSRLAVENMPEMKSDFDGIGCVMGYLASPLGEFLPPAIRGSMKSDAERAAAELTADGSLCLGRGFSAAEGYSINYRLIFMPPGKYKSPTTGRIETVDYPYWIFESSVTNKMYGSAMGPAPSDNDGNGMPVTHMGWYDILGFCFKANFELQVNMTNLPKGYMLRPPTSHEWEYAAMGGWETEQPQVKRKGASDRRRNKLGLINMDNLAAEYAMNGNQHECNKVALHGTLTGSDKNGVGRRNIHARDVCNVPKTTFRAVVAPTPEDFYKREAAALPVDFVHIEKDGCHYASVSAWMCTIDFKEASEFAKSAGAKLCEPESFEQWQAVHEALDLTKAWQAYLGIVWQDGKWVKLSNGKTTSLEVNKQPTGKGPWALIGCGNKIVPFNQRMAMPCTVLKWTSDEAWRSRGDAWKNGTSEKVVKQFTACGRKFTLIKFNVGGYVARALCNFMGGKLAVISDDEVLKEVTRQLEGIKGLVGVDTRKFLNQWSWGDGTKISREIVADSSFSGKHFKHSRSLEVLSLGSGKFIPATNVNYVLVEYTE